ncbi:MAG TPA: phenylalanine--tRNA ligase subunit beta [Rhodanobacter sp.]|nr:phenylalanine--tRNA ligase subunit beta [Rhodanobacter sp.]
MKFSENWLRELVRIDADRTTLVRALTMAGLEVEGVTVLGEGLGGVVVAQIVSVQQHPDADRLHVCSVDAGTGTALQIVCGAPNARAGIKVPLATVGASLPGGVIIKKAKLRGVESFGMLCSAKELGVAGDASGLLELPDTAPVGQPFATYLGLPDASIELSLTPNRADCLSMYGVAYDIAALFAGAVTVPAQEAVAVTTRAQRNVQLQAGGDAPRYLGRVLEGIDMTAQTPLWMAERLRRGGVRPLNPVVDVTNYVMLELGQPMHAFDHDTLHGDVVVRHARAGETLKLLDGNVVTLGETYLLVADQEAPLAVAGIMGGFASRVTAQTRNIFLESAHFAPHAIMGRARNLGLHTDASHRFERGVDPQLPQRALERASELLLAIVGGHAGPVVAAEHGSDLPQPTPVVLRRTRLARVLGVTVPDAEVLRTFTALGMHVAATADGWQVTAPSRRFDIEREEDLIEEVARIFGYDNIPTHSPSGALRLAIEPEGRLSALGVREQLAVRGYHEAVNLAFLAGDRLAQWGFVDKLVPLANPLSADLAVMRPSLLPGLVDALAHNRARQQSRVRLFEFGRVFAAGDPPQETPTLAVVACGNARAEQWGEPSRVVDFHDLKGDLDALLAWGGEPQRWSVDNAALPSWLHPGRGARVLRDGVAVGYLGSMHPRLAHALGLGDDIQLLELALEPALARRLPHASAVARFPSVRRDLAFDLPEEIRWSQVEQVVRTALGKQLANLLLFDRYSGKGVDSGRKSLAMGLILQDASRTLTDDDADRCVREAIAALEQTCKAKLRG